MRGLALVWLALTAACATTGPSYTFDPRDCAPEIAVEGGRCGTVAVPENYDAPGGRSIALNVLVLPSAGSDPIGDPVFELEGGPGIAVTATAKFYATDGAAYRQNREMVFVDMRGTGGSNPLRCPELEADAQSDTPGPLYPPALTAECARELGKRADLRQYTTANAVRDLDAVRQALGAKRIALNALSYGTTAALAYMTVHPENVSAAVLTSTVPADRTPPRFHASVASEALARIFAACAADAVCTARFPDPAADLDRARRRFADPEEAEMFMERLRVMMYAPASARRIPLFLQQVAQGAPAAPQGATPAAADGLYLSITCAESFPRFDIDAARREARASEFGDYRLRRQSNACAVWPTAPSAPPQPESAIRVPVLFVSGSFDPVSPPQWTADLLPLFPNSRHLVIEGGGHIVDGLSGLDTCYDPLITGFFETRDAENLDASCLKDVRPPAFVLE